MYLLNSKLNIYFSLTMRLYLTIKLYTLDSRQIISTYEPNLDMKIFRMLQMIFGVITKLKYQ